MTTNKYAQKGTVSLKMAILLLLTAGIAALVRFIFVDNMFEQEYFSDRTLNIFYMAFFLLIWNSLIFAIEKNNKYAKEKFLLKAKDNKLASHIKLILSSLDFYIEIITVALLSVLLPHAFLYGFVDKIFFVGEKLVALIIMLPIMISILFAAHIIIQKGWYARANNSSQDSEKGKKEKVPQVFKSVAFVALVYSGLAMIIPWFMPGLITLWNLGGVMLFVWILLAVIALIVITVVSFYMRAIFKRKAFVKSLKKYCNTNNIYLSEIKNPLASVFALKEGYDFRVEKNGTKYDCKFIAGVFKNSPIIFSDKGNALKQDTLFIFRVEVLHFMEKFDFAYESDGKKILVLLPTPKKFYVSTNDSPPRLADTGERVGEYTVYTSSGFLNGLDRGVL